MNSFNVALESSPKRESFVAFATQEREHIEMDRINVAIEISPNRESFVTFVTQERKQL